MLLTLGSDGGDTFTVSDESMVLGRDPEADVFLSDVTVSRRHCEIRRVLGGYEIRDLGSLNGTYVNGSRVDGVLLEHGDIVQVGRFKLRFFSAA